MTSLPMPILCRACARLRDPEAGVCDAFPNGIPDAIFEDGRGHHQPVPGDHGRQFKMRPGGGQELARWETFDRLRAD